MKLSSAEEKKPEERVPNLVRRLLGRAGRDPASPPGRPQVFTAASPKYHERLRALGVTAVVDYRSPTAVLDLVAAAKQAGVNITLALVAVVTQETAQLVVEVLDKIDGVKKVAHLAPWPEKVAKPEGVEAGWVNGTRIWADWKDLGEFVYNQLLRWVVADGEGGTWGSQGC
jgi:hypothetical protein